MLPGKTLSGSLDPGPRLSVWTALVGGGRPLRRLRQVPVKLLLFSIKTHSDHFPFAIN